MVAVSAAQTLRDLMQHMGHDSVQAPLIYQHGTAEADRNTADSIDSKIKKDAPEDADGSAGILAPTGQWHANGTKAPIKITLSGL
jgi:chemotaxis response regulator CheB